MGNLVPLPYPMAKPRSRIELVPDVLVWLDISSGGQVGGIYPEIAQVLDAATFAARCSGYHAKQRPLGVYLDGVDGKLTFAPNILNRKLAGTKGLSLAISIRPHSLVSGSDRNQIININVNTALSGVSLWFTDSGKITFGGRSSDRDSFMSCTSDVAASDGTNIFICGVLDFAKKRVLLWVDDKSIAEHQAQFVSDYYQPGVSLQPDILGATSQGAYPLDGVVQGFALIRRPLETEEIQKVRELMVR